jgi:hypothetical protein
MYSAEKLIVMVEKMHIITKPINKNGINVNPERTTSFVIKVSLITTASTNSLLNPLKVGWFKKQQELCLLSNILDHLLLPFLSRRFQSHGQFSSKLKSNQFDFPDVVPDLCLKKWIESFKTG